MAEITSFSDPSRVVYLGHRASKSPRDSKIMCYNPRKRPEMAELTSFADAARVVYRGVTRHHNPLGTRKSWVITHENGQNWPKSRLLPIQLESFTEGHRAWKSSQDPKIMGYNPRKRQEMAKKMSFVDASRFVYRGSQGIEILPGPKKRGL